MLICHTAPGYYSLCRHGKYRMYTMRYPAGCGPLGADSISSERSTGRGCAEILGDRRTAAGLNIARHCQWLDSLYWPRRVCVVNCRSWPLYINYPIIMVSDVKFVLGLLNTKSVIQTVQIYTISFKYHSEWTQNSYGQKPWPSSWKILGRCAIFSGRRNYHRRQTSIVPH